jgi:hypothetical protein
LLGAPPLGALPELPPLPGVPPAALAFVAPPLLEAPPFELEPPEADPPLAPECDSSEPHPTVANESAKNAAKSRFERVKVGGLFPVRGRADGCLPLFVTRLDALRDPRRGKLRLRRTVRASERAART